MSGARDAALKLLEYADRTEKQMREKLAQKGFGDADIDNAIEFLKEYDYINDADYAARFVEQNKKHSAPDKIVFDLVRKGIPREVAQSAVTEAEFDTVSDIERVVRSKYAKTDLSDMKERRRVFAHFARRGYAPRDIVSALDRIERADEDFLE